MALMLGHDYNCLGILSLHLISVALQVVGFYLVISFNVHNLLLKLGS